jgi:hypothetical protein
VRARAHDRHEFLERLAAAEARIAGLLLADARHAPTLVVVRRIDQGLVGERKELFVHAAVEVRRIAVLEVGASAPVDQEHIAGEDPRSAARGRRGTRRGVSRDEERLQAQAAERERFAFLDR